MKLDRESPKASYFFTSLHPRAYTRDPLDREHAPFVKKQPSTTVWYQGAGGAGQLIRLVMQGQPVTSSHSGSGLALLGSGKDTQL